MRKRLATTMAGALAVLGASLGPVSAFEQTPVTPSAPSDGTLMDGSLSFDDKAARPSEPADKSKNGQLKLPGMGSIGGGVLPRLDFGLDLLYGSSGQQDLRERQAPLNTEPMPDDDLRIMGTVKRRF